MRGLWKVIVLLGLLIGAPCLAYADDESELRQINEAYLQYWLANDAPGVMNLFEDGARISPDQMCPIEGYEDILAFWFPEDGSVTTIHRYEAEELGLVILGDLGVTTQRTILEWSYEKGDTQTGRNQEGINTTVFRRQPDGSWKIWRKMWTDVAISERQ